jgi:putative N6-adenine-specific DNA methylase
MQPFEYQKNQRYFAQFTEGFEAPATQELTRLGASAIEPGFRGVNFCADPATLYRVNYQARLLTRVLAPLAVFRCRDRDDMYREARRIEWPALFSADQTFAVLANVNANPGLTHSKFAALCLKDAVADAFRESRGRRPDVDRDAPDIWLNLYIQKESATISLDTSGGSLHRRGYRREAVAAPMQETLAAAMVAAAGWQGGRALYNPMCGAGTLLCEALMHASDLPAGYLRPIFGFQFLPDFDAQAWQRVKRSADEKIRPLKEGLIAGSDIDAAAVKAARINCGSLPGGRQIRLVQADLFALPALEDRVILCNPPYGLRLDQEPDLPGFYKALGDFLKRRCKGSEAYIYFGNRDMLKQIGLRPAWKRPMRNAGLDGRLAKFELY